MMTELAEDVGKIKSYVFGNERSEADPDIEDVFTLLQNLLANCEEDLQLLEKFLSDDNNMKRAVKKYASLGGNSIYNFVVRATQKLITNNCGANYNYLSRKAKTKFIDLNLWKLLMKSSHINFASATEKDVEAEISKWLKRCAERAKPKKGSTM